MIKGEKMIKLKVKETEIATAWMYAAQRSGCFSKYAGIWNDAEKQKDIIFNITLHQFDTLMYAYGHKMLMCLLDYFTMVEDYLKCAAIVRQVRLHNSFFGDKLPTANRKN
ncbi:MAG: hypothetical protein EOP56_03530 [Sphingobacteriales bacterium]|nr:MAG: hypothetical protein EOP56_03530 [Sphingobacteriales bacterium]